jgi:uncharacterized protein (TIGR00661 family)
MKFIFIVQGEGRGHSTQAIALYEILVRNNHEVCAVLIGQSKRREISDFVFNRINSPIVGFQSPNFVLDKQNKGLKIRKSFLTNLLQTRAFLVSLKKIDRVVKEYKPDVIVNFYDLLGGLYSFFYKEKRGFKFVCISHHYLFQHSEFKFPKGHFVDKFLLNFHSKMTSLKSDLNLALSFEPICDIPELQLFVVPPLLRNEVRDFQPENQNFILAYIVNDGYAVELIAWHENYKHVKLVCFWDRKEVDNNFMPHENIIFKKLNDVDFLKHLSTCSGYASTAGFESICEAKYFGKPVMMIPTANHFEQLCNGMDAERTGAGIRSNEFNISLLLDYLPKHINRTIEFKNWVNLSEKKTLDLILSKQ